MSDAQVNKLFAAVSQLSREVKAMKNIVERIARHSDAVLNDSVLATYHQHGSAIEHMAKIIEKLSIRCPMLKTETNEFPKVEADVPTD